MLAPFTSIPLVRNENPGSTGIITLQHPPTNLPELKPKELAAPRLKLRILLNLRPSGEGMAGRTKPHVAAGYVYELRNRDNRSLMAYHWHAEGNSNIRWPHLHIYPRMLTQPIVTTDRSAHIPTGLVDLEWVLWHVAKEFGVEAPGWEKIIQSPPIP